VKVRPTGKLYGSVSYVFTPTAAPPEHLKVTVTGHLANSGRTATITFHQTSTSNSANRGMRHGAGDAHRALIHSAGTPGGEPSAE